MSKSDQFTYKTNPVEFWSDFPTNFGKNPVTGLLAKVSNEESVKQSIKNLILTNKTKRPYAPRIGSKIYSMLFDPMDDVTESMIKGAIEETIRNYEPRASLISIVVRADIPSNAYRVSIIFTVINIPDSRISLPLTLKRIR